MLCTLLCAIGTVRWVGVRFSSRKRKTALSVVDRADQDLIEQRQPSVDYPGRLHPDEQTPRVVRQASA